jgi:hypothetical protein
LYPEPVVAAVNGPAMAGGCVLACAADHRVMAREAGRIGVPERLVGLPCPTVALEILRFTSVPQHLQGLISRGTTWSPQDALTLGLVDEMVAPEDLVDRAVAAAETLLAIPAPAFALTNRQLRQPVREWLQEARSSVDRAVKAIWTHPETREAVRRDVWRTCKKPRGEAREPGALRTFVVAAGLEPPHTRAKRALRYAVLWRKLLQGTDNEKGDRWAERTLSVRETCRLRGVPTCPVLVEAVRCAFNGQPPEVSWIDRN